MDNKEIDIEPDDEHEDLNYKPPTEKSLKEIIEIDEEDESLRKYKEFLLGEATKEAIVVEPNNPKRVIVKALSLIVEGRPDMVLDLSGNLEDLKKDVFVIKEGIQYKVKIDFYVQREIVTGLKYVQRVIRHGIPVEKNVYMVGSYPPKAELHSYTTPVDEMPSGLLSRGTYTVKSLFTDDDKNEHLKWEWCFELKKDWD